VNKTNTEVYPDIYNGGYICRITVNGVVIAEAWGKRVRDAKKAANDAARYNGDARYNCDEQDE